MKRIVQVVVIVLFMLIMSAEVHMAVKGDKQIQNRPANVSMAGGGGGNKNLDTLAQRPSNYKQDRPLNPKNKPDMPMRGGEDGIPAWMMALMQAQGAMNAIPPMLAGPAGIPSAVASLMPGMNIQGDGKGMDQLAQRPVKPFDQLDLKNKLFNQLAPRGATGTGTGSGSGGFGSSYGSNWRRGGGGGYGGGGGGGDYGYDNNPAWLNAYLRLNNWNIG